LRDSRDAVAAGADRGREKAGQVRKPRLTPTARS
jgi:hypothetical protein